MSYRTYQARVPDGSLAVGEWASGKRPVLAIHGLSSTHKLWLWTAAALNGCRLIAPDLRGRGASQGLRSSSGIASHRSDMLAVLDDLDIERATVVGMSLGGFIAAALAASHPGRVERLILVDGGLPMLSAEAFKALTRDQVAGQFRDRFQRIERTWPSLSAYREFFVSATASLLSMDDPLLDEYLGYDLIGSEPELSVRLDGKGMAEDAADLFLSDGAQKAARALTVPTRMLYAQWSVGRDSPPAYNAEHIAAWAAGIPDFTATLLPGTDHAATVMTSAAGATIAAEIMSPLSSHV